MDQQKTISGFSKLSKLGKIKWIVENFFKDPETVMHELKSYWLHNEEHQSILDKISENTISNYHLPYGVAPNFVINELPYCVPMVTEESSVVAAAASGAKFWMSRGGIKAEVVGTEKLGHVHFFYRGDKAYLMKAWPTLSRYLKECARDVTKRMEERGGGVSSLLLKDYTEEMPDYYQLLVSFETCDSMGANFINTVLERYADGLRAFFADADIEGEVEVLMSILSNYTPDSLVRATVECPIEDLGEFKGGIDAHTFARRFCQAVEVARIDPHRAATHNKGIYNGVDAVVIATGNDFRAIEASGHAYAARNGKYEGLSHCSTENGMFRFWLEIPLALGTVGGLTNLHPVAKRSFELLGSPSASELMQIVAATGLAQNFSALKSLVTTGIQEGHMRMHLTNILTSLNANEKEISQAREYFKKHTVSFGAVKDYLYGLRGQSGSLIT